MIIFSAQGTYFWYHKGGCLFETGHLGTLRQGTCRGGGGEGGNGGEEEITLSCYRCSVTGSLETAQISLSWSPNLLN